MTKERKTLKVCEVKIKRPHEYSLMLKHTKIRPFILKNRGNFTVAKLTELQHLK